MSGALQAVFQNQRSFGAGAGSDSYTTAGSYTWVAPAGVTSVSVVAVGPGGNSTAKSSKFGTFYYAGGGGGLGYVNNVAVTPGTGYSVVVGAASASREYSSFKNSSTLYVAGALYCAPGFYCVGTGGALGGTGGYTNVSVYGGGAGASGYSGNGGSGFYSTCVCGCYVCSPASAGVGGGGGGGSAYSGGGGVGLFGQGSNGAAGCAGGIRVGRGGSGGGNGTNVGFYGSGGAYGGGSAGCTAGGGAVRIVYPGTTRKFPSTCVGAP